MAAETEIKPALRRRFAFIEFLLIWEGSIGRKKLQDQFAISPQQATKDLTAYSEIAPDNLRYDTRQRTYLPSQSFAPRFTEGEAAEYLTHLELLDRGQKSEAEIWPTSIPEYAITSARTRRIQPLVLKTVLIAIRRKRAISAYYTSMSSPAGVRRNLVPHAIASDTHRWHVRAYDLDKSRWSDFVLSRLVDVKVEGASESIPLDHKWRQEVVVVFQVNPDLEDEKRIAIEREYEMKDRCMKLVTRRAMLFYELRLHGFDPWKLTKGEHSTSSFQLDIVNLQEVHAWLGRG